MIIMVIFLFVDINIFHTYALESLTIGDGIILDGGFDVLPTNDGNFFITSYDKDSQKSAIAYFDSSSKTISSIIDGYNQPNPIQPTYKYTTANFYNNFLYLTHHDDTNTTIEKYQIRVAQHLAALSPTITLSGIKIESPKQIAVTNDGNIFFMSMDSPTINEVTDSGISDNQLTMNGKTFHTITTDIAKNYLYAIDGENELFRYKISDGNYTLQAPTSIITAQHLKFLTDDTFITIGGEICTLDGSEFKLKSAANTASEIKNYPACVTAGFDNSTILAKTDDKVISRFKCSDVTVTGKIELTEKILALSSSNGKIIAVTGDTTPQNIVLLSSSDITEITPPSADNGNSPEDSTSDDDAITSEVYNIDAEKNIISAIPANTTFNAFKNDLTFNGYDLIFKDATGKIKTGSSSKVATGYTVTFVKDGTEKATFKLIVQGDITGTGSLSSRDISAFVNYLLGKTSLDETFLQAANINDDGEPDVIDLFLMYKSMQK